MKQIKLHGKYGEGKYAIVDDDDFDVLNKKKWFCDYLYYVERTDRIDGKKFHTKMHRVVNKTPDKMMTDHVNGNPLDNRKENLRTCTQHQNLFNRTSLKSISGFKGVSKANSSKNMWRASIGFNGSNLHIGNYPTKHDAAEAYNKRAMELFGEFASLNSV